MPNTEDPDVNPASRESERLYEAAPVIRTEHSESSFARMVEHQAAKIPSELFFFTSVTAMVVSLTAELTDRQRISRFVGMWPGPILIMGVYLKLVKTLGPR